MKVSKEEREDAIKRLREIVKPGDTLYTILRSVSSSGMSRGIDVYAFDCKDGKLSKAWLSYLTAKACGFTFNDKKECLRVGGCGMDMGFHVAYSLASVLYRDGFYCTGKNCPSNDHTNGMPRPEEGTASIVHKDGGYAVRHEWL